MCQSSMTALQGEAALFVPGHERGSPVEPNGFERLIRTALYRDTALLRLPYVGIPPYSDRLIEGYRLTQTAL